MHLSRTIRAACALALAAGMAQADGAITVEEAYARASTPMSKSGAAFMVIHNSAATDDRLIAASTPAAARAELHTHLADPNGVMRMVEVEDGFVIPAGGSHALARGGDHVMLMGLTAPLEQDATFPLTLVFEQAGEVTLEVPVDLERTDKPGGGFGPMKHDHGTMQHGG